MKKKYLMITLLAVTNLSSLQALSPLVKAAIVGASIGAIPPIIYGAQILSLDKEESNKKFNNDIDYIISCLECSKSNTEQDSPEINDTEIRKPKTELEKIQIIMSKQLKSTERFLRRQRDNTCDYGIKILQNAKSSRQQQAQDKIDDGIKVAQDGIQKVSNGIKTTIDAISKPKN